MGRGKHIVPTFGRVIGSELFGGRERLITLSLDEADDIERERGWLEMGEPYRTPLGFHHEVGHHFLKASKWKPVAHYWATGADSRRRAMPDS